MPKSRGRHPSKRKPPRTTQPTSYEGQAIKLAATLLKTDAVRVQAELLASEVLGQLSGVASSEVPRERRTEVITRLLAHADRRRTPSAAALLAAVQLLVERPEVQAALDEWGSALLSDLTWPTQPTPLPTGARTLPDEYDDHTVWFLDYEDCILAADTARWFHHGVLTVTLLKPGPISDEIDRHAKAVPVEVAARALRDGQQHTEMYFPPYDDEDYVDTAALLTARLRAIALPEEPDVEWEPLEDSEGDAIIDSFFASLSGGPFADDEVTRELADLCLTYGDVYIDGDRFAWSPQIVEEFLLEWVPRKTVLDETKQRQLPVVTYEWVKWALLGRGVSQELAVEAAEVALELTEDFLESCDSTDAGPAAQLFAFLEQNDIDPTDKQALAAGVALYNDSLS